jgi:bla regulator protein blaR1
MEVLGAWAFDFSCVALKLIRGWWIRARVVEERERVWTNAVCNLVSKSWVHPRVILDTCSSYMESRLRSASGVFGSALKKRFWAILKGRVAADLNLTGGLKLEHAGMIALVVTILVGVLSAPAIMAQAATETSPSFEVVSIKPNRSGNGPISRQFPASGFSATNITAKELIIIAYKLTSDDQLSGAPSWITSEKYDVSAKIEDSLAEKLQKFSFDQRMEQMRLMIQSLLADRFQMKVSHETKEIPVFVLIVAKNGSKLTPSKSPARGPDGTFPPGPAGSHMTGERRGQLTVNGLPITVLADMLSRQLGGRAVLDETGLKGDYDIILNWNPENSIEVGTGDDNQGSGSVRLPESSGASLFTALQEQLGLKLITKKSPMDTILIDHIEKPSGN